MCICQRNVSLSLSVVLFLFAFGVVYLENFDVATRIRYREQRKLQRAVSEDNVAPLSCILTKQLAAFVGGKPVGGITSLSLR